MIYEILISCGIGDVVTYLSRLDSLLSEGDQVKFTILGGYIPVIEMEKQLLLADPRVIGVSESMGGGDRVIDFRPDLAPLAYPIQLPFRAAHLLQAHDFAKQTLSGEQKTCVIQPVTTSGNDRGFEESRYWYLDRWQELINYLQEKDFRILQIGSSSDYCGFDPIHGPIDDLCGMTSIDEAVALVLKADLFIGTNSWAGEVSAYALKPTVYFFLTDQQNIPYHFDIDKELPEELLLITNREVEVDIVTDWIEERF